MKKRYQILLRLLAFLLLLVLTAVVAIQIPAVQTRLAKVAIGVLEKKIDGNISFDKLKVQPDGLLLTNFAITDKHPYKENIYGRPWDVVDTLAAIGTLRATFTLKTLLSGGFLHLANVQVDDGMLALTSEPDAAGEMTTNLTRIFNLKPSESELGPEEIFSIKKAEVNRFRFILRSFGPEKVIYHGGIHWEDMETNASVRAREMKFADGKMSGIVDWCTVTEKRGCVIDTVSGTATVGRGKAIIDNLRIVQKEDGTDLDLEQFSMSFKNASAFADFLNEVSLGGTFRRSRLAMKTLYNFSGIFDTSKMLLDISSGTVEGPVSDMFVQDLRFLDLNSNVDGHIERCRISRLPDVKEMLLDFGVNGVSFTSSSLSKFVNNLIPGTGNIRLDNIAPGEKVSFTGTGYGTLDDLHVAGDITSTVGQVKADVTLTDILASAPIGIGGSLDARSLQIGTVTGVQGLGSADFEARLQVILTNGMPDIYLDTLDIHSIGFRGYNYSGIRAAGKFDKSGLLARLSARDPNLGLDISGSSVGKGYLLEGNILTANLEALGFGSPAGLTSISGRIYANVPQLSKDNLDGNVLLREIVLRNQRGERTIRELNLSALKNPEKMRAALSSDFLKGRLDGISLDDMELEAGVHDKDNFLEFIVPGLYVADGTNVKVRRDTSLMNVFLESPLLGMGSNYIRGVDIDLIHQKGDADINIRSEKATVGGYDILNPKIRIGGTYTYKDGAFTLDTDRDTSFISFNRQHWDMGRFHFTASPEGIGTKGFSLVSGKQSIDIDGGFSSSRTDTLDVSLSNLGFGVLDDVLGQETGLKGGLDGNVRLISGKEDGLAIDGILKIDSLKVWNFEAGSFEARAATDSGKVKFALDNTSGNLKYISAKGELDTKGGEIDAGVALDGFNLGVAQPMLRSVFSQMDGTVSGKVLAKGKFSNLDISSDSLRLQDALVRVAITNVPYTVNGPIGITNQGADLSSLVITDPSGGRGTLRGSFNFNGFKNPALDASMMFRDLQLVNSFEDNMQGFYGTAYASGRVGINGPLNSLAINVDATTSRDGMLYIPLGNGANASESKILTFKQKEDDIDKIVAQRKKTGSTQKQSSDIRIHANVNATPNLGAVVQIDKSSGHMISVKGNGDVTLDIRPSKDIFDLGGDYNITDGKYHFAVLQNMAAKDFTIQPGSSIKFNGKPLNSQFDITALYKLKTSLSPLGAETRRNVECGLRMTGKIEDPNLAFSIDIPDLDPSTKSTVDGALNTDDKVQKQFLALFLTGNFVPGEESGVFFNTDNMVFSNLFSIMSGQLNNMLSYLNIPLDMGVNYQKNSVGNDIYDVAVSTQLFNNRVLVNGSVGNRQFASSSGSDFAGDIDIEVKLNKSGDFRVKAFSHSQDDYTNFLDNTQRSGIGMSIQREFNKFKDFWKSIFGKKEEKERNRLRLNRRSGNTKTITIDE